MFKVFFRLGDEYAKRSDWKDFALTKFCLFSMGILVGLFVPDSWRKTVIVLAVCIFLVTYIPLMIKVYQTYREMKKQ